MVNARAERLARHKKLRNFLRCDYCGILKNRCSHGRRPRSDRHKNHR